MAGFKVKPWHEWEVPPMWVWVVGGLVLIGVSTLVSWKISDSLSAGARANAAPPPSAAIRANPGDPDSF